MQTLTFDTTSKNVKVTQDSKILYTFINVPTVKISENGYYEVMTEEEEESGMKKRLPVARFPISNTNMIIVK